ncbi:MAG TPA: glycerol-3-phosphate acyltransferase [Prolixibacteraceae bacterium]|nr:glycerol-3-phosphate acyltransferase [Prolixibacteraceae bacterium]
MEIIDYLQNLEQHPWMAGALAAVIGYLAGSVSFARIIYFRVKKTNQMESWAEPIPDSDEVFESELVSASLVTKKVGMKYGCLTSLLDMAKVALPTLLFKLLWTVHPFFLLTALFGIAGHNWPVWYGWRGGRGESSILGVILVINWFGLLIANAAAMILGWITGSVLVIRWGGYVLLIFWFFFWFDSKWFALFMILANVLFWMSQKKDLMKFQELKKQRGTAFKEEEVSEFILMGKSLGRFLDNYSLRVLLKRTGLFR